jgi:hypothetical protein
MSGLRIELSVPQPPSESLGAARGLGLEVAQQLAATGVEVVIGARDPQAAAAVVSELDGVRSYAESLDIADPESVHRAATWWAEDVGLLDILINNAAAYVDWSETGSTADLEAAEAVMRVNLFGSWRMIQVFLPLLKRSAHPRIVNVRASAWCIYSVVGARIPSMSAVTIPSQEMRAGARLWRPLLVVAAVGQAVSSAVVSAFGGTFTTADRAGEPLIVPPGGTFIIWNVIIALSIGYAIWAESDQRPNLALRNRLARPLLVTCIGFTVWLAAAELEPIWSTLIVS